MSIPYSQSPPHITPSSLVWQSISHPSCSSKIKRGFDIAGALIGLVMTGLLFFPIAIAIQLDDPGAIFYSQVRCGYRGQTFRIWKFRSMVVNAESLQHQVQNQLKGHVFKNQQDPRVTRVGRFLRRTSLDELPQFWNVLLGQMSLVGTRPPVPDEVKHYKPHHWVRLEVKPGMTGEWQVNGRSEILDFEQIVEMDLRYQQQWSIWHDLSLIFRTIRVVLTRSGAY